MHTYQHFCGSCVCWSSRPYVHHNYCQAITLVIHHSWWRRQFLANLDLVLQPSDPVVCVRLSYSLCAVDVIWSDLRLNASKFHFSSSFMQEINQHRNLVWSHFSYPSLIIYEIIVSFLDTSCISLDYQKLKMKFWKNKCESLPRNGYVWAIYHIIRM